MLLSSSALASSSCAVLDAVGTRFLATASATGGYASDLTFIIRTGDEKLVEVPIPQVCLTALGMGATALDEDPNTSQVVSSLLAAEASLVCKYEIQRLVDEGKLVVAGVDDGEAG